MKHLAVLCCILLLTACAAPKTPSVDSPPESAAEVQIPAAVLSLSGLEPVRDSYALDTSDTVSVDTMGDILCDETLPDGREIVCYWEPNTEYTKYWAVRQGDTLLRFCQEDSGYRTDYRVEPFSDVLGHDGFRILCPRGVAYNAYDYYYLDEDGIPHLLAGCANNVLEQDADHDGQREVLWLSGGAIPSAYYVFQRDGVTYQTDISQWLRTSLNEAWIPLFDWDQWTAGTYAVSLMDWDEVSLLDWDEPSPAAEGYVIFTEEDIQLFLSEPGGAA